MRQLIQRIKSRKCSHLIPDEPFVAQIIFECAKVLDNRNRVEQMLTEFIEKHIDALAAPPKVSIATDGNVIQLMLKCEDEEDLLYFNREVELLAHRYGLRT